jgi:hypothetical protein
LESILKGYLADGTVEINQQRELIIEKISSNEEKLNEDTFENEEDEDDEVKYLACLLDNLSIF